MKSDLESAIEIKEGLWWVGENSQTSLLYCNPFLLKRNGKTILFDPGSVLDQAVVLKKLIKHSLHYLMSRSCSYYLDICAAFYTEIFGTQKRFLSEAIDGICKQ